MTGGAAYGATKAALESMTRAWAAEYSPSGVRVNAIAPGPVYTPTPPGPEFIRALGETTAMDRASQPEEIAEVIAFLASPRASYMTGADLRILLDLLNDRGTHLGRRHIGAETIERFLTRDSFQHYLGWQYPRGMPEGSFAHNGFTGTYGELRMLSMSAATVANASR